LAAAELARLELARLELARLELARLRSATALWGTVRSLAGLTAGPLSAGLAALVWLVFRNACVR